MPFMELPPRTRLRRARFWSSTTAKTRESILQLLLTKLGHQARTAEDVRTGIAVTRDFRPEIVFCDLMMAGGLSGYAFARAAREEEALAGLCIVAVSGWEGPGIRAAGLRGRI